MDCGILGIAGNDEVSRKSFFGLYDLQHRGEQAAGISVSDGKKIKTYKGEGLVSEVFTEKILNQLKGYCSVGHTRYSTVGDLDRKSKILNIQPLEGKFRGAPIFLAHNGNVVDYEALQKEAKSKGYKFKTYSKKTGKILDTEVILGLLATSSKSEIVEALIDILPRLNGSFSFVILLRDKVIGVRDQHGVRPLCLGQHGSSFILASESSAFHTMKADFVRDIRPGELIVLDKKGISQQLIWAENPKLRLCIFELIYFARPDSVIDGVCPYDHRLRAGEFCALEHPIAADFVTPTPESAEVYSIGYSRASGIPLEKAIFKNRYFLGQLPSLMKKMKKFSRTFISSRDTNRRQMQRYKFYCLRRVVQRKRGINVEDSLIRGNVTPEVVALLREKGAKEVHMRICSPPLRYPCFLGIDMATKRELIAASNSVEEIREHIGADSLGYLSLESLIESSGLSADNFCLGCFTGDYPVKRIKKPE